MYAPERTLAMREKDMYFRNRDKGQRGNKIDGGSKNLQEEQVNEFVEKPDVARVELQPSPPNNSVRLREQTSAL